MTHGGCTCRRRGIPTFPPPRCPQTGNTTLPGPCFPTTSCIGLHTPRARRDPGPSWTKKTTSQALPHHRTGTSPPSNPSYSKVEYCIPRTSSASSPHTTHCRPSDRRPSHTTHPVSGSHPRRLASTRTNRRSPTRSRHTFRPRTPRMRGILHSLWRHCTDPKSTRTSPQAGRRSSARKQTSHIG